MSRAKKDEGSAPENDGGEAGRTSAAAAAASTTNPNGTGGGSDDGDKKTPGAAQNGDDERDNTLWEQMTAREGRDAARRAGMSVGDWQAERQLQEALRESAQEAGGASVLDSAGADTEGEERSFVDAGFHALATSAVEGEEEGEGAPPSVEGRQQQQQQQQHASHNTNSADSGRGGDGGRGRSGHDPSAMMYSVDGAAAAAAAEAVASSGRTSHPAVSRLLGEAAAGTGGDDDEEDEEDFGEVELVVTQDGGIIPVAAAAAAVAAAVATAAVTAAVDDDNVLADGMALKLEKPPTAVQAKGKGVRKLGVRVGVEVGGSDGDVAVGTVRKGAAGEARVGGGKGGGGGDHEEDEEIEGEEEDLPLPPDIMLTLADDVLHRVMLFLHPEDIFECRVVSSRWEFPAHEAVFEGLCRRTYLAQSAKKLLNVKRWRSWERMYKFRPRLRDTGLYSLKTTYFKKPVRDMSTEWTPGTILKVTYYRYFRFFGDGRVAYGLMHEGPKEFVRMLQEGSPKVVYGTYTISKWEVNVEIPNPWSWVSFTLQLANGERGRFTHLVMLRHSSVPRNDARAGRCHHSVKSSDFFTFRRVWQF